ncbi:MAG: radical SAM protein [Myxococcota bacterium]
MLAIHGMTFDAFRAAARERLERGHGRCREVYRDVMLRGRFEPERHGLGPRACEGWRSSFHSRLPELVRVVQEEGPRGITAKAVLRTHDGLELETVLIPMGRGRSTLCVSSQVGCKMGCTFCETGRMGLLRNLSSAEIVGQLLVARHVLRWPVRSLVFMGMGEALDNYEQVVTAIRVLNDSSGLAMAQERLTVCTVGRADGIERLADEEFRRLNLSVSLTSADQAVRASLMPVARKTPLERLQQSLVAYRPRKNFTLGVNYCLLPDINDSRDDARAVAEFCGPLSRVLVHVIPYNPGGAPIARAPTDDEVARFIEWLREEGLPVRKRVTKGRSVMAACGQLGNVELRERRRLRVRR